MEESGKEWKKDARELRNYSWTWCYDIHVRLYSQSQDCLFLKRTKENMIKMSIHNELTNSIKFCGNTRDIRWYQLAKGNALGSFQVG